MSTTHTFRSITKLITVAAAMVALAGAETALAQAGSVEITPVVGYRWGGQVLKEDNPTLGYDAKLKDSSSIGLIVDIPITYHLQIQLAADHQSTGLRKDRLFAPPDHAFDLDVNYYHIGLLGQWPGRYVTPFVVGALGVADLRPETASLSDSRRFSTSLGGGVKVPLGEHVAFRLEAKGYWSDTSDEHWDWSDDDCDDHHGHNHCRADHNGDLVQGQIKVGVAFSF